MKIKKPKIGVKKIASLLGLTVLVASIFGTVSYLNSDKYLLDNVSAAGCNVRNTDGVCTEFEYASGTKVYTGRERRGNSTIEARASDGTRYYWEVNGSGRRVTGIGIYDQDNHFIGNLPGNSRIRSLTGKYYTKDKIESKRNLKKE